MSNLNDRNNIMPNMNNNIISNQNDNIIMPNLNDRNNIMPNMNNRNNIIMPNLNDRNNIMPNINNRNDNIISNQNNRNDIIMLNQNNNLNSIPENNILNYNSIDENINFNNNLEMKNNEIQLYNNLNKELTYQYEILKNKELEIKNNILEMNLLNDNINKIINNYSYIFKTQYLQLEVSNRNNESSYIWNFNKSFNNVIGIKLMTYSLPSPKYNINKNKNDNLKIKIDDIIYEIIIPYGYYTINELITIINKNILELKINENNIIFSLDNITQKINIKSNINIELISTLLLKNNLGFTDINKINLENDDIEFNANNIWDLRLDSKVYLFLKNISNNEPYGILYFNNISICNLTFNEPIKLDFLEISFIDEYGIYYNFYNSYHELNFIIEKNI